MIFILINNFNFLSINYMTKTKKRHLISKKNKSRKIKPIKIKSNFDMGNIKVLKINQKNKLVELTIKHGPMERKNKKYGHDYWFYFKAENIKKNTRFYLKKLTSISDEWYKFDVCYSYDNKTWHRFPTHSTKTGSQISWKINPKKSTVWFAYYPPYPFSKSKKLFKGMKTLGYSKNRRPILMKKLGSGSKIVWVISGQHPGETIHSWMLEGFVKRLMERKSLMLKKYTFYIVPNLNPDGNIDGNWRYNSQGVNLNRDWIEAYSNEVKCLKNKMNMLGYDLVLDLHGDENCKKHFLVSSLNHKHYLHDKINKELNKKNKNFQIKNFYSEKMMSGVKDTLDDFSRGITIEGAMKHPIYNHKTLQDEPMKIGKDLVDILADI